MFNKLNIPILKMQETFTLVNKMKYTDIFGKVRTLREMKYTPDFLIDLNLDKTVWVEVKGYPRKDYNIRKKLFIMKYHNDYHFLELKSDKKSIKDNEKMLKELKS